MTWQIRSYEVIDVLADVMLEHGVPAYLRSNNGPETVATSLRRWLTAVDSKTLYIEAGNGYCESFNGKPQKVFHTLRKAQMVIELRRRHYSTAHPIVL